MRTGLIAAVLICAACEGNTVQVRPGSDAWTHYRSPEIAFDHPPSWKERPQQFVAGSFSATYVILSTSKPDQSLCYRRLMPDGSSQEGCDPKRMGKLAPGDVVLIVGGYGMPGRDNILPSGEPLVVDGHHATLGPGNGSCAMYMGGDVDMTLTISYAPYVGFVDMDACGLKVPDLERTMRRLAATTLVTSVSF